MSAPPGRSATVHSLSGRVNALKFMQRASPSTTPTKPSASSSTAPSPAAASPSASVPGSPSIAQGAEEEQWALSPAAIATLRAKAQPKQGKGPVIEQEAGFDAWLISTRKQEGSSSRQTFGRLGKQKQDEEEGKKRSRDDDEEEPELDEDESAEETPKGFVKPGSLGNRGKAHKERSGESNEQNGSPSSSKKARKDKGRGSKDQDKVVYARKRGGKPGISGGGR